SDGYRGDQHPEGYDDEKPGLAHALPERARKRRVRKHHEAVDDDRDGERDGHGSALPPVTAHALVEPRHGAEGLLALLERAEELEQRVARVSDREQVREERDHARAREQEQPLEGEEEPVAQVRPVPGEEPAAGDEDERGDAAEPVEEDAAEGVRPAALGLAADVVRLDEVAAHRARKRQVEEVADKDELSRALEPQGNVLREEKPVPAHDPQNRRERHEPGGGQDLVVACERARGAVEREQALSGEEVEQARDQRELETKAEPGVRDDGLHGGRHAPPPRMKLRKSV